MSNKLKVVILSIIILILAFAGIYHFKNNKTSKSENEQVFQPTTAEDFVDNYPGLTPEEIDEIMNTPLNESEAEEAARELEETGNFPIIVETTVDEEDPTKIWFKDDQGGEGYYYADNLPDDDVIDSLNKDLDEWRKNGGGGVAPDHLTSIEAYTEYLENGGKTSSDTENNVYDTEEHPYGNADEGMIPVEPDVEPITSGNVEYVHKERNPDGTTIDESQLVGGTEGNDYSTITVE